MTFVTFDKKDTFTLPNGKTIAIVLAWKWMLG